MDVILALDPGKRTGVAIGRPGKTPLLLTVNFSRELDNPNDVRIRAFKWMERAINGALDIATEELIGKPTILAIEAPVPPSAKRGFTTYNTTPSRKSKTRPNRCGCTPSAGMILIWKRRRRPSRCGRTIASGRSVGGWRR